MASNAEKKKKEKTSTKLQRQVSPAIRVRESPSPLDTRRAKTPSQTNQAGRRAPNIKKKKQTAAVEPLSV